MTANEIAGSGPGCRANGCALSAASHSAYNRARTSAYGRALCLAAPMFACTGVKRGGCH